ncbi:MAG: PilT/PilU family type 4a pilus ATPase [Candidatus Hydrogenedentes bacterium]|nr:PilT/PilU family type 4a pilus ATPase [Candidatus Hydrogenedentota bacterium]
MAVFLMGTGAECSLRSVIGLLEKHLLRTEGIPRRIHAWSGGFSFEAERADFDAPFAHFVVNLPEDWPDLAALLAKAEELAPHCSVRREENGVARFTFAPKDAASVNKALKAVDAFSASVTLPEVWRAEGGKYSIDHISVELLFKAMVQYKASDVHLSPGVSPVFRIDGETRPSELLGPLSAVQIMALIEEVCLDSAWEEFQEDKQTSFNYHQAGLGYSRVSAFMKSGAPHCTFRFLPETIPSFEDLHVPKDTMVKLAELHRGLLLVTGMTGSGKTTTVAALIDWINSTRSSHILTIENPIEFVHINKKSIVSQRNLGMDVRSFGDAVTGALRHDPDVILIGEMRDPDTIRSAINAAATGHLVISTLHANTAAEVVNRVISFFDPVERDLVKLQLRDCLQCVICQRLVPKIGGGRIPALEMMLNDIKAIADGVMEGSTDSIRIGMQQTVSHSFLFEHYLYDLFTQRMIDLEHAQEYSTDASMFDQIRMGTYAVPRLESMVTAH